uniref:N-acyl-aliphatic-L-amino acid amidohydrolase n=1 Tax=Globodera rostochiensis TaxID=31243 RepID=A0A914H2R8_GLORO
MRLLIFFYTFCTVSVMKIVFSTGAGGHKNSLVFPSGKTFLVPSTSGGRQVKSLEEMPWKNKVTVALNDATKRSKSLQKVRMTKNDIIGIAPKRNNDNKQNVQKITPNAVELKERNIFWNAIGSWKGKKKEAEVKKEKEADKEPLAVTRFRQYLRINTEQPRPDYQKNRDFLFDYAAELGLQAWEYECVPGKLFVGITIDGTDPNLPALLLYSHSDVVPTVPSKWIHPPYDAFKDAEGNIYARGAQDMKCVGVQYMEALRLIFAANGHKPFLRTVHILFGPDEEIGGYDGMEKFIQTDKFRAMNVGFALDEGLASETDEYRVFYGERAVWWLKITCRGAPGHGSRFIENSAGPKLSSILNSFNEYRARQHRLLKANSNLFLGDVTSVNLTKIEGGVQQNVIPNKFTAYFDVRVTPTDDYKKLEAMFTEWCTKAGPDVVYEFVYKSISDKTTPVDPSQNEWWRELSQVFSEEKCKISKEIFCGGTDSRYLRQAGIPAIGFSPMINTPVLLHDHNEFLNERVFMDGVQLYSKIVPRLANLRA